MTFDPYQPPRSERQDSAQSTNDAGWLNVGTFAAMLLGTAVGAQLIEIGVWLTIGEPTMYVTITSTVGQIAGVVRLAGIAVFLVWIHRVIRNAHAFGVQGLQHSPAAAVGYWFIPLLNLVHGYRVVAEAWRTSDPEDAGNNGHRWMSRRADNLILHWWLAYLASRVVITVARFDTRPAIWITGVAVEVVAVVLMTLVVRRLDARQGAYARRLLTRSRASTQ